MKKGQISEVLLCSIMHNMFRTSVEIIVTLTSSIFAQFTIYLFIEVVEDVVMMEGKCLKLLGVFNLFTSFLKSEHDQHTFSCLPSLPFLSLRYLILSHH